MPRKSSGKAGDTAAFVESPATEKNVRSRKTRNEPVEFDAEEILAEMEESMKSSVMSNLAKKSGMPSSDKASALLRMAGKSINAQARPITREEIEELDISGPAETVTGNADAATGTGVPRESTPESPKNVSLPQDVSGNPGDGRIHQGQDMISGTVGMPEPKAIQSESVTDGTSNAIRPGTGTGTTDGQSGREGPQSVPDAVFTPEMKPGDSILDFIQFDATVRANQGNRLGEETVEREIVPADVNPAPENPANVSGVPVQAENSTDKADRQEDRDIVSDIGKVPDPSGANETGAGDGAVNFVMSAPPDAGVDDKPANAANDTVDTVGNEPDANASAADSANSADAGPGHGEAVQHGENPLDSLEPPLPDIPDTCPVPSDDDSKTPDVHGDGKEHVIRLRLPEIDWRNLAAVRMAENACKRLVNPAVAVIFTMMLAAIAMYLHSQYQTAQKILRDGPAQAYALSDRGDENGARQVWMQVNSQTKWYMPFAGYLTDIDEPYLQKASVAYNAQDWPKVVDNAYKALMVPITDRQAVYVQQMVLTATANMVKAYLPNQKEQPVRGGIPSHATPICQASNPYIWVVPTILIVIAGVCILGRMRVFLVMTAAMMMLYFWGVNVYTDKAEQVCQMRLSFDPGNISLYAPSVASFGQSSSSPVQIEPRPFENGLRVESVPMSGTAEDMQKTNDQSARERIGQYVKEENDALKIVSGNAPLPPVK